jgi:hypothetical protein
MCRAVIDFYIHRHINPDRSAELGMSAVIEADFDALIRRFLSFFGCGKPVLE